MAKRGRKRKFKLNFNIKPDTVRSVSSLILILLAVVSLVSFFFPDYKVNSYIQEFLRGLFGFPSILLPFILGFSGMLLIERLELKAKEFRLVIGLFLLLFTLCGLLHVFISPNKAYEVAQDGEGGGLVGYKISSTLQSTISIWGSVPVLVILLVMDLIIIFDVSLNSITQTIKAVVSKLKDLLHFKNPFSRRLLSQNSDMVEVSSGSGIDDDYAEPAVKEKREKELGTEVEPSFEVIPSMSEPQDSKEPGMVSLSGESSAVPTLPYTDKVWEPPSLDLLLDSQNEKADNGDVEQRAEIIVDTLRSFGISTQVADVKTGPSVTQYALRTDSGVKISKVANLHNDLALALASPTGSVRIEAPIPGKSLIGVEVPNNNRVLVNFKSLITSEPMKALKSKIGIVLGKDVAGKVYVYDIAKMPHMLIAGTTGSGKSVFIHNILFSILYRATPQEVKFILVDPKRVELIYYQDIPHLMTPVVTDMEKAPSVFKWAVSEMERRYKLFEKAKARNIEAYNEKSGFQALPYIVIIVDELGEIMVMDPAGIEKSIIRIAQLARATGIHLVLSVQRPSTNIITGLIKANIPCRVAFNVASQIDSRVIIDQPGAEKLLGKGDMLFIPPDIPKPLRLQGAFVSDTEINRVVSYLKEQGVAPDYKEEVLQMSDRVAKGGGSSAWGDDVDELFDQAAEIVISAGKGSASLLQRKLSIGYTRAARILDELEAKGIVGSSTGSKARNVLMDSVPLSSGSGTQNENFDEETEEPVESLQEM